MSDRTAQSLLIERRANCIELGRERDVTARELLATHIALIDLEIASRTVKS